MITLNPPETNIGSTKTTLDLQCIRADSCLLFFFVQLILSCEFIQRLQERCQLCCCASANMALEDLAEDKLQQTSLLKGTGRGRQQDHSALAKAAL